MENPGSHCFFAVLQVAARVRTKVGMNEDWP